MTEHLWCVITCSEIPALLEAARSCLWPIYEADGWKVKRAFVWLPFVFLGKVLMISFQNLIAGVSIFAVL